MSHKLTTRGSGYLSIEYDQERRELRFEKTDGRRIVFYGVPSTMFYGMPTGPNVQNYIDLKLRGHFLSADLLPPPPIHVSQINQTVSVERNGEVFVYSLTPLECMAVPPDPNRAWVWFQNNVIATNRPLLRTEHIDGKLKRARKATELPTEPKPGDDGEEAESES